MKTNQLKYESPMVEILEISIEQGFAISDTGTGSLEDPVNNNPMGW